MLAASSTRKAFLLVILLSTSHSSVICHAHSPSESSVVAAVDAPSFVSSASSSPIPLRRRRQIIGGGSGNTGTTRRERKPCSCCCRDLKSSSSAAAYLSWSTSRHRTPLMYMLPSTYPYTSSFINTNRIINSRQDIQRYHHPPRQSNRAIGGDNGSSINLGCINNERDKRRSNHDRKWVMMQQKLQLHRQRQRPTLLMPIMSSSSSSLMMLSMSGNDGGGTKGKKSNEKKKSAKAKQQRVDVLNGDIPSSSQMEHNNDINNNDCDYYIQFSRVFQRHVVYRLRRLPAPTTTAADINDEVIQSFPFLDEAIASYPNARLLAPKDIPFPPPSCIFNNDFYHLPNDDGDNGEKKEKNNHRSTIDSNVEENECETTIAGMGMYTLCDFEYNDNSVYSPISHDEAHAALRTLLDLVSSSQSSSGSSAAAAVVVPRHFFKLDIRRLALMGHTPQSIHENYVRVVNLLGGGRYSSSQQQQQSRRNDVNYLSEGGVQTRRRPHNNDFDADDIDDDSSNSGGVNNNNNTFIGIGLSPTEIADVLQNFPMLLLYNHEELECLLRFLISPLPMAGSIPSVTMVADRVGETSGAVSVDWPSLSAKGYGAGLTTDQAKRAIQMMPELLALYYENSRKPSITSVMYYHQRMPDSKMVPPKLIDETKRQLDLEGSDPTDAYTFAYLHCLGVSWSQLRILASALPLWTTVNLDPSWEIVQKGPVRSMFKRPALDYLRQRLQIGPCDINRLVKTHTRLSMYDSHHKILPALDRLQGILELSSAELKKLVLRQPSLIGVGVSAFEDRLDFFMNEAGMSMGDLKVAILKQPSLMQYNVNSTLRPKLQFFINELGISDTLVCRIVKSAPAVMGLSLNENLRPKVVSIMLRCALSLQDVGYLIATSPQILLLSQKGKIEPTLRFLSTTLMMSEAHELGDLILAAPRVFHQGLETSIAKKIEIVVRNMKEKSKTVAAAIIRNNPTLLSISNAVLESRIERCLLGGKDLTSSLLPSAKGRRTMIKRSATTFEGCTIVSTPTYNSLDAVTKLYASPTDAAHEFGMSESAICEACKIGKHIDGTYLRSLDDFAWTLSRESSIESSKRRASKVIPISIFCSGGVYPSDSADVARGQRRTGGMVIQVFTDGSCHDKPQFLREFAAAARSCLGIRVPIEGNDDGSKVLAVFPLVNPSKNRCDLFSCSRALTVLEECLKSVRSIRRDDDMLYDITIYTDSNYAWKLVKSKERLIELGSHRTAQEMLTQLGKVGYSVNIDILHPLARSFGRLNGMSTVEVTFLHSTDAITPDNGGQAIVKRLKRQAKLAARWQEQRDRQG